MKKMIATLLVLAIMLTFVPVNVVMAAGDDTPIIAFGNGVVDMESDYPYAYVPVTVTNNPGIAGIQWKINTPEGMSIYMIEHLDATEENGSLFTVYDKLKKKLKKAPDLNETHNEAQGIINLGAQDVRTEDGVLFWVVYEVSEEAYSGTYDLSVVSSTKICNENTAVDITSQFEFVSGTLTVEGGKEPQAVTTAALNFAPAAKNANLTAATTGDASYTLETQWYKGEEAVAVGTKAAANTTYTAKMTLTAKHGYAFNNESKVKVNETTTYSVDDGNLALEGGKLVLTLSNTTEAKALQSVAVKTNPNTTGYYTGDTLNLEGIVLTATYDDGSTEDITSGFTAAGPLATNQTSVEITYQGLTCSTEISAVTALAVDHIEVTGPTKTTYLVGEELNPAGLVVTAVYNKPDTTKVLTESEYELSGFSSSKYAEDQVITVTAEGKTATFTVDINRLDLEAGDFTIGTAAVDYTGSEAGANVSYSGTFTPGTITTLYDGSETIPTAVGTYTVSVIVTESNQYNAVTTALEIGTYTINAATITAGLKTEGTKVELVDNGIAKALVQNDLLTITTVNGQTPSVSYAVKSGSESYISVNGTDVYPVAQTGANTAYIVATITAPNHSETTVEIPVFVLDKTSVSDKLAGMAVSGSAPAEFSALGEGKTLDNFVGALDTSAITADGTVIVKYTLQKQNGSEWTDVATATALTDETLKITAVGTYKVVASYEDNSQKGTMESASFTVVKSQVTEPAAVSGLVYSAEELTGVEIAAEALYELAGGSSNKGTNAGSYTTNLVLKNPNGYEWAEGSDGVVTWSIGKKAVTVTPAAASKVYGQQDPTFKYTTNLDGDLATAFEAAYSGKKLSRATGESVAAYEITLGEITDSTNFAVTKGGDAKLTISQKDVSDLSVTASASQNIVVEDGNFVEPVVVGVNGDASVAGTYTYSYGTNNGKNYEQMVAILKKLNKGATGTISWTFAPTDGNYSGTKSGSFTFEVVDVAFEIEDGAITEDPNAVYGDSWSEIVTIDSTKIKAKVVDDCSQDATFTLVNGTAIPKVNGSVTATGYTVVFNGTINGKTYTNVPVVQDKTVTIAKKGVTISGVTAEDKAYDTTVDAIIGGTPEVNGALEGDVVSVDYSAARGDFADKNVGVGKTVTFSGYALAGADAGNYVLSAQPASVTADITAVELTVSGVAATERAYEQGNKIVALTGGTLATVLTGDDVTVDLSTAKGEMENANVGTGKAVTVTGVKLGGADAGNYTLAAQPTGVTVTITAAAAPTLTVSGQTAFKYTVTGEKTLTISGVPAGETIETVTFANVDNGDAVLKAAPTWSDGKIVMDLKGFDAYSADLNAKFDVKVKVSNHAEATISNVNITITERDAQAALVITSANKMTYGETLTLTTSGGSGTGAVSYALAITGDATGGATLDGNKLTATQAGTVIITATKEGDLDYSPVTSQEFTITIQKATPTAEADYTKITVAKKTLADAALVVKASSVPGTIQWVDDEGNALDPTTEIEANKSYKWLFTPNDATNYNTVSGELVPYFLMIYTPVYGNAVQAPAATAEGTVALSTTTAIPGATVVVYPRPAQGYKAAGVTVLDAQGNMVPVTMDANGNYTFTMPNGAVQIVPTFVKESAPVQSQFVDVPAGAWYEDAVNAAVAKGLFGGMTDTTFAPNTEMSRSMLVTVLWRLAGKPDAVVDIDFDDVQDGLWYSDAVAWAAASGVVTGMTETAFGTNGDITREQMAAMLYRYAKLIGLDTTAAADLSAYKDSGKVSSWAQEAMAWCVANGIIGGVTNDTLAPSGDATRAQVATILVRFCEKFGL